MRLDFIGKLAPFVLGVASGMLFLTADWYFATAIVVGYGAWFIKDLWVDKVRNVEV